MDYQGLKKSLTGVQRGLEDIKGNARSHDGMITATVSGRGELLELDIDSRVFRDSNGRKLSEEVLSTVRRAAKDAAVQTAELSKSLLPPGDLAFDRVLRELDRLAGDAR